MSLIKKDDNIIVVAGKDKGKTGRVLKVYPKRGRVLVEHINVVKKAQRKTQQDQQGGLIEIETSIHVSNVMLFDHKSKKPTRLGTSILKDGSKVRISRRTGEVI